jgi:hypothetical protein
MRPRWRRVGTASIVHGWPSRVNHTRVSFVSVWETPSHSLFEKWLSDQRHAQPLTQVTFP